MAGLRRVFALNRTVDRAMPCQAWSHSPVIASTAEAGSVGCSVCAPSNYGAAEPQAQRIAPADSMPGNSGADGAQACLHFRWLTLLFSTHLNGCREALAASSSVDIPNFVQCHILAAGRAVVRLMDGTDCWDERDPHSGAHAPCRPGRRGSGRPALWRHGCVLQPAPRPALLPGMQPLPSDVSPCLAY